MHHNRLDSLVRTKHVEDDNDYQYFRACDTLEICPETVSEDDETDEFDMFAPTRKNWFQNGDVFLARLNSSNTQLSTRIQGNHIAMNIEYDPQTIQLVKLPKFAGYFYIHQNETLQSKSQTLTQLISNTTNMEGAICLIITEYIPFFVPLLEFYASTSKRHFTVPYFQFKNQFTDFIIKCNYITEYGIHSVPCSVFEGIKSIKDIDFSQRQNFSMPTINVISCDESDLSLIPKWLKQIFWLFKHQNTSKPCNLFFRVDLYLTNIANDKYDTQSLKLIATKYDTSLASLISMNNDDSHWKLKNSLWFDAKFDEIYLKEYESITISVGGNNDASNSRHWFQIYGDGKSVKFENRFPILTISMAVSNSLSEFPSK